LEPYFRHIQPIAKAVTQLLSINYVSRWIWQVRPFAQFVPQHRHTRRGFDAYPYIAALHAKNLQVDTNAWEYNPILNTTR
jgi:hypothetical protein